MDPTVVQKSRCHTHPGRAAVGECGACGRPVCLECAVPVRGELVGQECLRRVLPDPPPPPDPPPAGRTVADRVAIAAFAVAAGASLLGWSRFGAGAGSFTAWGLSPPRWAWLAGLPAVGGLVLAILLSRPNRRIGPRVRGATVAGLGGTVLLGAALFALRPPPFTQANVIPWFAAAAAAIALGAGVALLRAGGRVA